MIQQEQKCSFPEVWGGIECTIARIGNDYYDQLMSAGHYERSSDIPRLAELGIKALRYPILWERHQPSRETSIDWTWTDEQLTQLREENITPIAGLLHHGSGPVFTDLTRDSFADDLAAYAGLVAARYPWIGYYTPVNEPLTTARFSGLYGIWYPHATDALLCMKMLLNQVKGVVRSMAAIRRINPGAQLVQTEDLGFTHSTEPLSYQADFENQRRWLTYDLLCGKVGQTHPLWSYLLYIGIKKAELLFFTDNPCPPDLLGINYYVTSERFLDGETHKYPSSTHGGNGNDDYADVAAARAVRPLGLLALLEQVWRRYELPIAITESHLNCTREQQLRWLNETWQTACQARNLKIDVRAVTSWALMGAYDWDSLLSTKSGSYESGAYSIIDGVLKRTAIGEMIKMLAATGVCEHPLLETPGWWHGLDEIDRKKSVGTQPLLIIGKAEYSRRWFQACHARGIVCRLLFSFSSKLTPSYCERLVREYQPWGLIIVGDMDPADRAFLSEISDEQGLPCLIWQNTAVPDEFFVQTTLDLFIDEVMTRKGTVDQLINTIHYDG